jgi:outer membrane protein assembly factor BamA
VIGLVLAAALAAATGATRYDGLVAEGLAQGRAGDLAAAATLFEEAIALDPSRPEAHVERGGVWFSLGRYDEAAWELREALRLREDPYARDLLGSSLHLAGRSDQALAVWNVLERPTLRTLSIGGLERTRDRVARREIPLREGELLGLDGVREARLRLAEVGAFERVSVRPVPRGGGVADVEVALVERHGFALGWLDFVASAGVDALQGRARLRYANVAGEGISLGLGRRWETHRPETSARIDWPRPLGLDAVLHVRGFDGRQDYRIGAAAFEASSQGVELALRRVLGGATIGAASLRTVDRRFAGGDEVGGRLTGVGLGLERRLEDDARMRAVALAQGFVASAALGSDARFVRGLVRVRAELRLTEPRGDRPSPSVLAAQLVLGRGSHGTPIDEAFAAGGSPDMELPLRAHPQAADGVLGRTPLARSLLLGNLEWRRRLMGASGFELASVLFYDGAGLSQPGRRAFHDVGVGLRLGLPGAGQVRFDYGHGLTDGADAFFLGLGQVF